LNRRAAIASAIWDDRRGRDRRGEDPDKIVRRLPDVLGRDPDDAGLRQYAAGSSTIWSEEQVQLAAQQPEYATGRR
jgi:hypothetical protein